MERLGANRRMGEAGNENGIYPMGVSHIGCGGYRGEGTQKERFIGARTSRYI